MLALQSELLVAAGNVCVGGRNGAFNTKNQQLPPPQVPLQTGICVICPEVAWDCQETAVSWRSKPGKELAKKQKVSAFVVSVS